ncbi:hypothetical protein M011DRAFT_69389 [Sporormia fimetaria CBS 119925]|uniref:Uncharacterized protein n=1 Tax=Sporormia fimetaria CBS 119925 TaxID=1340428 RepID=A0A6A6V8N4_9PLEO|nr:hypothetical protein M011DRAFT_69389 [Sporormia fimetaria CBS 119925]
MFIVVIVVRLSLKHKRPPSAFILLQFLLHLLLRLRYLQPLPSRCSAPSTSLPACGLVHHAHALLWYLSGLRMASRLVAPHPCICAATGSKGRCCKRASLGRTRWRPPFPLSKDDNPQSAVQICRFPTPQIQHDRPHGTFEVSPSSRPQTGSQEDVMDPSWSPYSHSPMQATEKGWLPKATIVTQLRAKCHSWHCLSSSAICQRARRSRHNGAACSLIRGSPSDGTSRGPIHILSAACFFRPALSSTPPGCCTDCCPRDRSLWGYTACPHSSSFLRSDSYWKAGPSRHPVVLNHPPRRLFHPGNVQNHTQDIHRQAAHALQTRQPRIHRPLPPLFGQSHLPRPSWTQTGSSPKIHSSTSPSNPGATQKKTCSASISPATSSSRAARTLEKSTTPSRTSALSKTACYSSRTHCAWRLWCCAFNCVHGMLRSRDRRRLCLTRRWRFWLKF